MIYNVLFLCQTNTARSLMAEALLNHHGTGVFKAYSAGIQPPAPANDKALLLLKKVGLSTDNLYSKHYSEFEKPDAPKIDFVIALCDKTHGEICPIWPHHANMANWEMEQLDAEHPDALHNDFHYLENRINLFTNLPQDKLEHLKSTSH